MTNLFLFMSKLQGEFSFQLTDVSALVLLQLTKFAAFMDKQHKMHDLAGGCFLETAGVTFLRI